MTKVLITVCACFCLSQPVLAWNMEGHMLVAQIAYNHLDPEVKAKCDTLLTNSVYQSSSINSNFVTAAVWADDIKSFTTNYSASHYIDLPVYLDGGTSNAIPNEPSNVVVMISQYVSVLQNPTSSASNQAVALRFLLHFVGDISQPLHCSTLVKTNDLNGDNGGNGFSLGGGNNLHSFWDGGGGYLSNSYTRPLTGSGQSTLSNRAATIEAAYPYTLSVSTIPDSMDWAVEGREIARTNTYVGVTNGFSASASYTSRTQTTTIQRMAIGGQRLAKLLNTIFVTNAPVVTSVSFTNNNFGFSWSAVSGRTYRVQWKQQITDAVWSNLTDVTSSTNSIAFTNSVALPQRFYRAIVVN